MHRTLRPVAVIALIMLICALRPAAATVFDLTTDFRDQLNPNGLWAYYLVDSGHVYPDNRHLLGWENDTFRSGGPGFGSYPGPIVFRFPGSSTIFTWPSFHAGLAVVFTLPYDSPIIVSATSTISGGNPSINLSLGINGSLQTGTGTPDNMRWEIDSQGVTYAAGTEIYLWQGSAGCCGQYTYNTFTITLADIPEPSTIVILSTMLAGLGWWRDRWRSAALPL